MSRPPGEPQEEAIKLPDVLPVLPLKDAVSSPTSSCRSRWAATRASLAVDQALADKPLILLRGAARRRRTKTRARPTSTRSAPPP